MTTEMVVIVFFEETLMKFKKQPFIILLIIVILSWIATSSFASIMTNSCCKQSDGASNCPCKSNAKIKPVPCENLIEYLGTLSEPPAVCQTAYKQLIKHNSERSGIISVNLVTLTPDHFNYLEYTSSLPCDLIYYGWSQDRSPPSTCA
jgi:hypothetical protein